MASDLEVATVRPADSYIMGLRVRLRNPVRPRAVCFALLLGIACSGLYGDSLAWGQDDWDAVKDAANPPAAMAPQIRLPDFDQWVFARKTRAQVRQMLMSQATVRLDSIEQSYQLSEAQRKKLELAARGDIRRFLCLADEAREQFDEIGNDQQNLQKIVRVIQPLQAKMQGSFFDDRSLLHKALKSTLNDEQCRKYEEQQRDRRRFVYEAKIELALVMLEAGVPLREQQRQRFVKLLLDETEPPRKFGRQACYVVFYQAGTLPEDKLKPIFDDAQWWAVKRMLSMAKGMGAHLKSNGFVP